MVMLEVLFYRLVCFVFVLMNEHLGITEGVMHHKLSFLLVGVWWCCVCTFSLSRLPKSEPAGSGNQNNILINGYKELSKVWRQLTHLPILRRLSFSFFFFNMGVQTVMLAATLYGKGELGIPTENLIIAILIIQLIAIPGAYAISKLSSVIGNLKALMLCVTGMGGHLYIMVTSIPKADITQFYIIAVMIGFVMGGIQSLSRSTYAKLMPETKDTASFFSFYDVSEKIGIVAGLFLFGFLAEKTNSQRTSVLR